MTQSDLLIMAYRTHLKIVERWRKIFGDLRSNGWVDDRSKWTVSTDENGEMVVFNERVSPELVFGIFNSDFLSTISKNFYGEWEAIVRFSFDERWEVYVSKNNSDSEAMSAFKMVGWRMKDPTAILAERTEDEDAAYCDERPKQSFVRRIMD